MPPSKPLTRPEPRPVVTESWWTRPEMLRDRVKFQERLVSEELARMNRGRFGGHGRVTDSGITPADETKRGRA